MATFKVKGGIKLKGDLHPQGAKNEVLQVLCAVLLTSEEVIIENVPNIRDVNILIDLLRNLNVSVNQINESTYSFKADNVDIRDHSDPLMPKHKSGSQIFLPRNTVATFDTNGMRINPNQCGEMDTVNALLVGDSNIAGIFLDDSETLGAKITERSLSSDKCISVDTFGVSGFGVFGVSMF